MAKLQAKTPEGLFKQIKPTGIELRGSVVETPYRDPYSVLKRDYLSYNGSRINNGQLRSKYTLAYNGTAADAQKSANIEGIPVGTHDPKMKRFLPRTKGKYGQVRLPEQWNYKTGTELATAMTRAENVDADEERSYGPSKYRQQIEDILDMVHK